MFVLSLQICYFQWQLICPNLPKLCFLKSSAKKIKSFIHSEWSFSKKISQMGRYHPHQNNYIICCANGILSFLQFVIWIQSNLIANNFLLCFMYCTYIVKMININLFIEEGSKREVNHSLGLFKTIYYDFLCLCAFNFQSECLLI